MKDQDTDSVIVRVFIGEDDRHQGVRLYETILNIAQGMHLAGGTVLRDIEGFGSSGTLHSSRQLSCSEDLPMVVAVADTRIRLKPFVARAQAILDEANAGGLITVERAQIIYPKDRQAPIHADPGAPLR